jgi:hypothetical protein
LHENVKLRMFKSLLKFTRKNHSISATGAGGISNSYPKTALGNFVIKCVNGDLRVGTVFLDAATCLGKGNMTEDTSLIYSK